jgi:hypothetical protein
LGHRYAIAAFEQFSQVLLAPDLLSSNVRGDPRASLNGGENDQRHVHDYTHK